LRSTERAFNILNMRSADQPDLTARASIRNAALQLFADRGPDAVTVRQIASATKVSPALVLHHFGSKAGLRQAVDDYVAGTFEAIFEVGGRDEVLASMTSGDSASLSAAFAQVFPADSPLPAYLRRLLVSGDPAGSALFGRWLEGSRQLMATLDAQGLARPSRDPDVRAAFLLANDLAVVLLRDRIHEALGFDPLDPVGVQRWGAEVTSVYAQGVWMGEEQ
jgi:TetR/AcrR family transcriptional regulator, regulator of cefoperazone and chloramphenicol sensitivity